MTVDIDQVALDIARQFVDGGQRKAQLQVAIIEAINRFAKPGSAWKADRADAAWVVASPSGDACEVRDTDRSPYAEVMRQLAQSLGNSEIGGEVDVYYQIADMIEPHVQREGINPNGALPASVHDSVQILFEHWLATRNSPVPDPFAAESAAFETHAKNAGLILDQHPLHYLFLDEKTHAARQAWKAALQFRSPAQAINLGKFRPLVQAERHRLAASVDRMRYQLTLGLRPDVREKIRGMYDDEAAMLILADDLLSLIDSQRGAAPGVKS